MIRSLQTAIGETVDLGWVAADPGAAQRFWRIAGLPSPDAGSGLPLGVALALRGGPIPAVELAPDTISFHAGHTLSLRRPFVPDRRYRVLARIAEVFEKSGRSGPLTVIARTAELCDDREAVVVAIREQQIARWRGEVTVTAPRSRASRASEVRPEDESAERSMDDLDIGSTIGVLRRRAPDARIVSGYAGSLGGREPFFDDPQFARGLGFTDVIVPGPIQSALFEGLLMSRLPGWDLTELSLSFRVSVIVDEPITLSALVIELSPEHDRLLADLTLENSSGERAAVGTATLLASPASCGRT